MEDQIPIGFNNGYRFDSIESKNLKLRYFESFFSFDECEKYIEELNQKVEWKNEVVNVWGKKISLKRRTSWYGDIGKEYTYSGLTVKALAWNSILLKIKKKIEAASSDVFNSVLLNDYCSGDIGMGWHSDDEKELGKNPVIASVSFGAERDFYLRHKTIKDLDNIHMKLKNGSLLLMLSETQHHWEHSIPKRLKVKNQRINLTFRKIL
tara:strand:- start:86 stop:709 length:624 start_codon:yes stop_codon:yes gene_type:complete